VLPDVPLRRGPDRDRVLVREPPIGRNGELEATNYFFGVPGHEKERALTFDPRRANVRLRRGAGFSQRRRRNMLGLGNQPGGRSWH
jgi:hypothetical protein